MNLDSITLLRTKSKVMNRIKLLAPGVLFVCLVISLLFILVGMKAQKRKIGCLKDFNQCLELVLFILKNNTMNLLMN